MQLVDFFFSWQTSRISLSLPSISTSPFFPSCLPSLKLRLGFWLDAQEEVQCHGHSAQLCHVAPLILGPTLKAPEVPFIVLEWGYEPLTCQIQSVAVRLKEDGMHQCPPHISRCLQILEEFS